MNKLINRAPSILLLISSLLLSWNAAAFPSSEADCTGMVTSFPMELVSALETSWDANSSTCTISVISAMQQNTAATEGLATACGNIPSGASMVNGACEVQGGESSAGMPGPGMMDTFGGFPTGFGLDTSDMANDTFGRAMMQLGGDFDVDPRAMSDQAMGAMRGMMQGVQGVMDVASRDASGSMQLNFASIDRTLNRALTNWDPDRIGNVERSIMRMCIAEVSFSDEVPAAVALNEALEVARLFVDDDAVRFINGVLDNALKSIKQEKTD